MVSNTFVRPDLNALLIHLLNLPYATNRPTTAHSRPVVDELVPLHDIVIRVREEQFPVRNATLPLSAEELSVQRKSPWQIVRVPVLEDYTVVAFYLK